MALCKAPDARLSAAINEPAGRSGMRPDPAAGCRAQRAALGYCCEREMP